MIQQLLRRALFTLKQAAQCAHFGLKRAERAIGLSQSRAGLALFALCGGAICFGLCQCSLSLVCLLCRTGQSGLCCVYIVAHLGQALFGFRRRKPCLFRLGAVPLKGRAGVRNNALCGLMARCKTRRVFCQLTEARFTIGQNLSGISGRK